MPQKRSVRARRRAAYARTHRVRWRVPADIRLQVVTRWRPSVVRSRDDLRIGERLAGWFRVEVLVRDRDSVWGRVLARAAGMVFAVHRLEPAQREVRIDLRGRDVGVAQHELNAA